jgi:hypothetical protein
VKGKTNASYQLMLPYASIDAEAGAPRFEKSIPDAYGSRFEIFKLVWFSFS